jgi:hypothetical protein
LSPEAVLDQGAVKGADGALMFQNRSGVRNVLQWVVEGALEE